MRLMEKKVGLILGGIFLFSLVLVGIVMAVTDEQGFGATVTVNEFLSITISDPADGVEVAFGGLNPDTDNNPDLEQDTAQLTPAITVANDVVSNVNVNVDVKGADFVSAGDGSKVIAVGKVTYDDDGTADQSSETDLAETVLATTYGSSYHAGVTPSSSVGFWFFLDVPSGQAAASDYQSTFTFKAQS